MLHILCLSLFLCTAPAPADTTVAFVDVTVIPARKRLADDLDVVHVSHGASIASLHGGVTEHRLRFVGRCGERTGRSTLPVT